MLRDLTSQQRLLADFMSDISERCYYAGWMKNLEYVLWHAVLHGERNYGHDTISTNDIKTLTDFSEAANAWIIFDDDTKETAIDLNTWREKFEKTFNKTPS